MGRVFFIAILIITTSACVPTSYEPLQEQQSSLSSYWQKNISADITQYSCIVCHHSESIANNSDYVLLQNVEEDYLNKNLEMTLAYLQRSNQHGELFLSKSRGLEHTQVLELQSDKYLALQSFVEMATQQDEARSSAIAFYKENISDDLIQGKCTLCHGEFRLAGDTRLIFVDSDMANYQDINVNRIIEYGAASANNFDNLFLKATGTGHGGGEIIKSDSQAADLLSQFLQLLAPSSEL